MTEKNTSSRMIKSLVADLASYHAQHARQCLAQIGKKAVPALVRALADPREQVRWEAAKALSEIADPTALPALVAALEDRNSGVSWLAAEGLIAIGRESAVPILQALVDNPRSVSLRQAAHHVLHDLGQGELTQVIKPVLTAMGDIEPDIAVPSAAVEALAALSGETAEPDTD
jgi:HEAT repeat protein